MSVVIETTIGDITVDLFTDERPIACLNFLKLCTLKYYNFNLFHTVEQGFIAQTGDPTGVGNDGCSIWGVVEGLQKRFFEAESLPKIHHSSAGLLSLVSAGKNMAGSQFFFTLGDNLTSLDGIHCVIGEVVEGHDILRKLNDAIVDEKFRPYQDIRITHTVILDDPFPNPRGFRVPSRSPSPTPERLQNGRIAADEDIDDTDGKTMEELQEMLAEREAKARATILEIVGDLPDADMAPPENVLFVCKLNPVTTDDDLEIIFSRFGVVKSCEVIRDKKTGDSLQYAFVEFEEQKSCEAAYFKMDNVLIDDRRIHVDFSQSVAKLQWKGKGRGVVGDDGHLDFNNLRSRNHDRGRDRRANERNNDRYKDRPRMDSEERKKAREERHREQRERELAREKRHREDNNRVNDNRRRPRSRSPDRSRDRGNRNSYNERRGGRSPRRNEGHEMRRRDNDSRDRTRNRRQSPPKRRRSEERRGELERNVRNRMANPRDNSYKEKALKRGDKNTLKQKAKKSKHATSSSSSSSSETSDESSDDSESDSTDSSTDSSSTSDSSSSSSDERSKRKKSNKSKNKKKKTSKSHKSKHKKTKKKHRK